MNTSFAFNLINDPLSIPSLKPSEFKPNAPLLEERKRQIQISMENNKRDIRDLILSMFSAPQQYLFCEGDFPGGHVKCLKNHGNEIQNKVEMDKKSSDGIDKLEKLCGYVKGVPNGEDAVFAFEAAKNMTRRQVRQIINTYHNNPDIMEKYASDILIRNEMVWFYLTESEIETYRSVYSILQEAKTEPKFRESLFITLEKIDPAYCDNLKYMANAEDKAGYWLVRLIAQACMKGMDGARPSDPILWGLLYTKYMLMYYGIMDDLSFTEIFSSCCLAAQSSLRPAISQDTSRSILAYFEDICKGSMKNQNTDRMRSNILATIYMNNAMPSDEMYSVLKYLTSMKKEDFRRLFYDYMNLVFLSNRMTERYTNERTFSEDMKKGIDQIFKTAIEQKAECIEVDRYYTKIAGGIFGFAVTRLNAQEVAADLDLRYQIQSLQEQRAADKKEYARQLAETKTAVNPIDESSLSAELQSANKTLKSVRDELYQAKKKISSLEAEVEEHKEEKDELVQLRNIIFAMNCEQNEEEKPATEQEEEEMRKIADFLNSKNGVILGGHDSFHQRISPYLPSWKIVPPQKVISRKDARALDMIVACTNYLDHGSYTGTEQNIRSLENCHLILIHQTNISKVLSQVYEEYMRQTA